MIHGNHYYVLHAFFPRLIKNRMNFFFLHHRNETRVNNGVHEKKRSAIQHSQPSLFLEKKDKIYSPYHSTTSRPDRHAPHRI